MSTYLVLGPLNQAIENEVYVCKTSSTIMHQIYYEGKDRNTIVSEANGVDIHQPVAWSWRDHPEVETRQLSDFSVGRTCDMKADDDATIQLHCAGRSYFNYNGVNGTLNNDTIGNNIYAINNSVKDSIVCGGKIGFFVGTTMDALLFTNVLKNKTT